MDPNNVVGTPNVQTQPVAPVEPVVPVSQPEPNPMVAATPEKKSGKGGVIAAILFAILVVGGIGFGVYTMMDSNTQKDKLNDQIAALKKTNSELVEKVTELNEEIASLKNSGTGDNTNDDTGDDVDNNKLSADVEDGVFYIKDQNNNIVIQSENSNINTLVSCDYVDTGEKLKCAVTTFDGDDGWFLYNISDGLLTSSFDKE